MTRPKLTRIYVVVLAFSLTLATIAPLALANLIGLTISDCHAILTNSEKGPIFLNGDAFRTSPQNPDAAWFAVDKFSLTSILKHNYKAYPTEHFTPSVPPAYYAKIKTQTWFIIFGCGIVFIVILGLSLFLLGKLVGSEYGTRLFNQAIDSFGDPTTPYRDEITSLKAELDKTKIKLSNSDYTRSQLREELELHRQKNGPVKYFTQNILLSKEEERAIKSLGMTPEQYFTEHNKSRIVTTEGKPRRRF